MTARIELMYRTYRNWQLRRRDNADFREALRSAPANLRRELLAMAAR